MFAIRLCNVLPRLLTAVCVVSSLGCGFFGPDPNGPGSYQAVLNVQEAAEEKLKAQGAQFERKTYPQGSAWAVNLSGKTIDDETFSALKNLDHVSELNLSGTTVTDEQLARVSEFATVLLKLDISNTGITDQGLGQLDGGFLTDINASRTKVTPEGVNAFFKKRAENPQITAAFKKPKISR